MTTVLRRFVTMLVIVALTAVGPGHFAVAHVHQQHAASTAMECCPEKMQPQAAQTAKHTETTGAASGYADHACCVAGAVLPERPAGGEPVFLSAPVAYWRVGTLLDDRRSEPEPLPPRAG